MTFYDLFLDTVRLLDGKPDIKKIIVSSNKTFQFNILDGQHFYVEANGQDLKVTQGDMESPSATISASDQNLQDIFSGRLNGIAAFMQGKLKISGDVLSVQKLSTDILNARK